MVATKIGGSTIIDPSLGVGEGENSWVAEQFVSAGLAVTAER